tara:strand:+ start:970 stop:1092 length:123 start_codon:yes stop_codon:yes gene_type:complete
MKSGKKFVLISEIAMPLGALKIWRKMMHMNFIKRLSGLVE